MSDAESYILEIYRPGSRKEVWNTFSSSAPFRTLKVGDMMHLHDGHGSRPGNTLARVAAVEHVIWATEETLFQKAMVFTEAAESEAEGKKIRAAAQRPWPL